jgi:hypothetical protein
MPTRPKTVGSGIDEALFATPPTDSTSSWEKPEPIPANKVSRIQAILLGEKLVILFLSGEPTFIKFVRFCQFLIRCQVLPREPASDDQRWGAVSKGQELGKIA